MSTAAEAAGADPLFAHFATFRRILVTGPQRSGTTIASRMIAHDTGLRCVDESAFEVYNVARWRELIDQDGVVVQCPHMLRRIVDEPRTDVLVVLMRRDLEQIHASELRIGWEENYSGNSAELSVFGLTDGDSAQVKYDYWETHRKPPHFVELPYDVLARHSWFVPAADRTSFGRKDTGAASVLARGHL